MSQKKKKAQQTNHYQKDKGLAPKSKGQKTQTVGMQPLRV